ncbi:hypothetical protein BC830DRAFT_1123270 [Chytriomyces sp. MP71]|nr:hypothetical protein BC830DRAFT_1123270 [Chytriomyces sp. MP71]
MQLNAWPFIVAQMLDTQGNTLCYTYTELSTDLPPNTVPTCPSVKKLDTSGPLSGGETSATASSTSSSPAASSATTIQASTTATMHDGAVTPASNSGTYTTTSTIASLSNSSETIFQITNILVALIIQTKENKAALVNRRQNNNDPDYNTNEDDEVNIPNSNPKFRRIYNQDKSTTFIYTTHSRNITVPSTYTPTHVYNGHVVGRSIATGSLKRFYPESAVKPYIPDPDAPQNVTAGQSNCWLAPPPKVPRAYVEGMNKNWPRYETDYNRLLMQYDAFNKDNCTTQFSPSSLGNH